MHVNYGRAHGWTGRVIGAAIEVHRDKGSGLIESIYQRCLIRELELRSIPHRQQVQVPVQYKGVTFQQLLRLDAFVDDCLVIELKAIEQIHPVHKAQLLSYMKLMDAPLGLLINFGSPKLVDGISRLILPGASP